jgi:osmotically-inducible protein OsmY
MSDVLTANVACAADEVLGRLIGHAPAFEDVMSKLPALASVDTPARRRPSTFASRPTRFRACGEAMRPTPGEVGMATATVTEHRTDEQMQRDVLAELKWDARVLPNEIAVAVKDGIVTLTGSVDSYLKRLAAEEAAHRVRGVKAVANDIEVRLSSVSERSDAKIAAAAVRALEWDAAVSVDKLDVTVSKGWVTLKGDVEWYYQRQDAERVVRRLMGVKGVTNLINVKPRPTPSELKEKIEKALVRCWACGPCISPWPVSSIASTTSDYRWGRCRDGPVRGVAWLLLRYAGWDGLGRSCL